MSKRTNRRATQRAAHKANRQAALSAAGQLYPAPETDSAPSPSQLSDSRMAANRANSQLSTGPITSDGKSISCRNALKHGLTGNTILLDSDDADAYESRLDAHVEQFQPVTFEERRLVQSIHDAAWRLDRILSLESTIYAKGRIELQGAFEELPPDQRKNFIQLETVTRYAKELRNLHIQEGRLQRQRSKDIRALNELISARRSEEQVPESVQPAPFQAPSSPLGFEFSICATAQNPAVFPSAAPVPLALPVPPSPAERSGN